MRRLLQEANDRWREFDEDTDEFTIAEFQDRTREGIQVYLDDLLRWEIPTPHFHYQRFDRKTD